MFESPFGAELEDAPFVLVVCAMWSTL
eukprot:SAG31_NODE_26989_length_433_cov_0.619760_1_plen_26_part_01